MGSNDGKELVVASFGGKEGLILPSHRVVRVCNDAYQPHMYTTVRGCHGVLGGKQKLRMYKSHGVSADCWELCLLQFRV